MSKWKLVWQAHRAEVQSIPRAWLQAPEEDEALPPLSGPEVRRAAGRFTERTGLGVENWNPRVLRPCSQEALAAFAQLLMTVEASLLWPAQVHLLIYFMIPKLGGGLRPIGKMPTLVRLWETARFPLVAAWTPPH